jgi:hypothetical protein
MASILRHRRRSNFTVLPCKTIRDSRLSFRATGLLAFLLSLPDGTPVSSTKLGVDRPEGRDAIQTAFRELRTAGYVAQHKEQLPDGRWVTVTEITDEPPETGFQVPETENPFPEPGKPVSAEPVSAEPSLKAFSINYEELQRGPSENPSPDASDNGVAAPPDGGDPGPDEPTSHDCANGWIYTTDGDAVLPCPTCRPLEHADTVGVPDTGAGPRRRDLE